jgi:hypothetical protein
VTLYAFLSLIDSATYSDELEQELYQTLLDMIPGLSDKLDEANQGDIREIADLVCLSPSFFKDCSYSDLDTEGGQRRPR